MCVLHVNEGKFMVYRYRIVACACLYEVADAPNCLLL
jgi:hypothetical protein